MKVEDMTDQEIEDRLRTIEAVTPRFGDFSLFGMEDMALARQGMALMAGLVDEKRQLEEELAQRKFERRLAKAKERGKA